MYCVCIVCIGTKSKLNSLREYLLDAIGSALTEILGTIESNH